MTAKEHNRLLGIFFYIYLALQVFGFIIGIVGVLVFFGVASAEMGTRQAFPFGLFAIVFGCALIISALLLIPIGVAGYKLSKEHSNAKLWGIIASILAVIHFPLGTALGIYGLWFLFGEQGKDFYDNGTMPDSNPMPPQPNSWQ